MQEVLLMVNIAQATNENSECSWQNSSEYSTQHEQNISRLTKQVNEILIKNQTTFNLTIVESINPEILSKSYYYDVDSDSFKKVKNSAGLLIKGSFKTVSVNGLEDFVKLLDDQKPKHALVYGISKTISSGTLVTTNHIETHGQQPEEIARTKNSFSYPQGAGFLMLDYDPSPGSVPLTREEVVFKLCKVVPELKDAPMVIGDSASSHLYYKDKCKKGAGGLRIHIAVANACDIPRAGKALCNRLWLAGFGHIELSKSGAILKRTIIDSSVFQPERLDFVGGVDLKGAEVSQHRPPRTILNGGNAPFNLNLIKDLSDKEKNQLNRIVNAAITEKDPERAQKQDDYATERASKVRIPDSILAIGDRPQRCYAIDEFRLEQKNKIKIAIENRKIFGDFELIINKNGDTVTVGTMLDNPDKWHGKYIPDPFEPEYNDFSLVGWINLKSGSKPHIHSHAHGGIKYELMRQEKTIKYSKGDFPRLIAESMKILNLSCEIFQQGGQLVKLSQVGDVIPITAAALRNQLDEKIQFIKYDEETGKDSPQDCPYDLDNRIMAERGNWPFPELAGVIKGAVFKNDKTLFNQSGYDSDTQLILTTSDAQNIFNPSLNPTKDELKDAFNRFWHPFSLVPFKSPIDHACQLAAMLTTIQRPILQLAPGIAYSASMAGSGKTSSAKATAWLNGSAAHSRAWLKNEDKQENNFLTMLSGSAHTILFDNITSTVASSTFECILTEVDSFSGRQLYTQQDLHATTRKMFVLTGNNLQLSGDLWRRIIKINIDHGVEDPTQKKFSFDMISEVKNNWQSLRNDGLTLIAGFIAAGAPRISTTTVGTYEQWDRMIRQCVLWLADSDVIPFKIEDPAKTFAAQKKEGSEQERLAQLLVCWRAVFGLEALEMRQITDRIFKDKTSTDLTILDLRFIMMEIASKDGNFDSTKFSGYLRRVKGQIIGDTCFESEGEEARKRWKIVSK